jgi:beta-phosphoglucomutase
MDMEIKACLFDLDGVIVDTAKYHFEAWRRLANHLGIDFTIEENEELKGISRIDSLNLILGWGGIKKSEDEILDLAALKNNWYLEMIASMQADEILPGVRDFIKSLKLENIKIGLGSASKNSEAILKKINLLNEFDVIIDGTKVSQSKPSPEVFLRGAAALEILPQNCLVFEDALSGVEAAINAGMRVVGIGESQILYKADMVIDGFQELNLVRLKTYFNAIDK